MRYTSLFLFLILMACQSEVQEKPAVIDLKYSLNESELFAPGIISTQRAQRDLAISTDGLSILYTESTPANGFRSIVEVSMGNNEVSGQEIASFSGSYNDIEPFFAPDGWLYFSSDRPVSEKDSTQDYNIWKVQKENGAWGTPEALPENINTEGDEFYPSLSSNGNLYFTASYLPGLEFIWLAEAEGESYQDPVKLDSAINSSRYQFNAYVSPDEDLLIFSSWGRADGKGGGDLYVSTKDENGWTPARNLEKVNSGKLDYCPFVDQKNQVFYFTSNQSEDFPKPVDFEALKTASDGNSNGMGSIYRISASELY